MLLKKNKGFFLLELLLSLAAWFMLCLFILPLLMELNNQSLQLEVNNKAEQLLYEELQAELVDVPSYTSYTTYHHGIAFQIIWTVLVGNAQKEVCVKVDKNNFLQKTEICAIPE